MTITEEAPQNFRNSAPNDRAAEAAVLGSMILSRDAIGDVCDIVSARDFYQARNVTVFKAILSLYTAGTPVDGITLTHHLAARDELKTVGADYIQTLLESVPTAANGAYYARIVREKGTRRRAIVGATRIVQLAENEHAVSDTPIGDQAMQIMQESIGDDALADNLPIGDYMHDIIASIESGQQRGLSTGLADLDELTYGLQPGAVWIVAGRPGIGKSVALVDIARHVALKQGLAVQFFSLEMTRKALVQRMLAAETKTALRKIKAGGNYLDENDWSRINDAAARISEAPLYIDQRSEIRITDIAATTRRLAQRQNLGLVVVDYLQLMQGMGDGGHTNREQEIAKISRGLKVLAKDINVPIIAAAQLNRGPEMRTEKRPQLADLRESGSIEQDADVVILLHRPDYYDKESPRSGEVDYIVAKSREGETDTLTFAAQLTYSRFVSMQYV
jgi:replicative DNA helicase